MNGRSRVTLHFTCTFSEVHWACSVTLSWLCPTGPRSCCQYPGLCLRSAGHDDVTPLLPLNSHLLAFKLTTPAGLGQRLLVTVLLVCQLCLVVLLPDTSNLPWYLLVVVHQPEEVAGACHYQSVVIINGEISLEVCVLGPLQSKYQTLTNCSPHSTQTWIWWWIWFPWHLCQNFALDWRYCSSSACQWSLLDISPSELSSTIWSVESCNWSHSPK